MPTPCNLLISDIPGSSEKVGREDTVDVYEVDHNVHQPFRQEDGMPSGVRVHSPIRVVCEIDKANPGLFKSCCTARKIPEVTLQYWRIDPDSHSEVKYYEIKMKNARCVDIRTFMPTSFLPNNEPYRHMVQYSFVYEEIEWNYMPETIIEMDHWRSPGAA